VKPFNLNIRRLADGSFFYSYDMDGKRFDGSTPTWDQLVSTMKGWFE
jgi:hypothetical protein